MSSMTCHAEEPPTAYSTSFENTTTCLLYVPTLSAVEAYKADEAWSVFTNILPIDATGINSVAMEGVSVSKNNGQVSITGLCDNENVCFYTLDGKLIGTSKAVNGIAQCYIQKSNGVVIAKIGKQSIKITL
ncbi:MAG: hypothetical protein Q4D41_03875 [Prevotellaceae bacterium]|nr:hypothetical protein [Prevotellaceae bacterium]